MFESDLIERFSRVHPLMPAVMYIPLALGCMYVAAVVNHVGVGRLLLEVFCGYLVWTLFEYWLHRLVFHLPVIGPKTERIAFLIHGVHHDYPWDETRLVMPTFASLGFCVATFIGFRAMLGPDAMYGPFAGFVIGYVIYDEMHWYVHAQKPTSRFGRWLRREHFLHHFREPTSRFGVSCPWLDYVFGTRGTPHRRDEDAPEGAAASVSHERA